MLVKIIADCQEKLDALDREKHCKEAFLTAIRRFMEMGTLTAPLLHELIDHIDVYETEGTGKNRTQRIVIYYRFVGYIELPDSVFQRSDHRYRAYGGGQRPLLRSKTAARRSQRHTSRQ